MHTVLVPFIWDPFSLSTTNLQALVQSSADVTVLGFEPVDPARYGRLIMNDDQLERIVEFKDASDEEIGYEITSFKAL